jgi:homoserine kinase type II
MAVYTKLSENDIKIILSKYDLGELTKFSEISKGVENTNYFIFTENNKYVLTIFEKRVNKADLPYYLGLMDHLHHKQFPVPEILKNNDHSLTFSYKSKTGIIISFLDGQLAEGNIDQIKIIELGEKLAKMHLLTEDFELRKDNNFNRQEIKKLYDLLRIKRFVPEEAKNLIEPKLEQLLKKDFSKIAKGTIHADLFPDNVFFKNNHINGVIDFYFSCFDYLIIDLAICINAWCFDDNNKLNIVYAKHLLNHYTNFRKLSQIEIEALNDFCLMASLRFYLTRLYDFHHTKNSSNVEIKDPKFYLEKFTFFSKKINSNYLFS